MGYLAAVGVLLLLGLGIFCFGYASRRASLLSIVFLETFCGLLLITPFVFWEHHSVNISRIVATLSRENLLWLSAAAICGFVGGNFFSLWNLRVAGEKVNSLLSPAITALAIAFSVAFLSDKLRWHQWTGIALTMVTVTVFLVNRKAAFPGGLRRNERGRNAGIISGLLSVIAIALTIITTIKGATGVSFSLAIAVRLAVAFVVVAALFLARREWRLLPKNDSRFYLFISMGVLVQTLGAAYLWLYASFHISIAVFQTILATLPLWIYAVDVYVLKRSKPVISFPFAAVLALVGVALAVL